MTDMQWREDSRGLVDFRMKCSDSKDWKDAAIGTSHGTWDGAMSCRELGFRQITGREHRSASHGIVNVSYAGTPGSR